MKVFDSITSSKWNGKGLSLAKGIIVAHRTANFKHVLNTREAEYSVKIIGKKRTGNGRIDVSIISDDETDIVSKSIIFSKNSWTEFSFNFKLDRGSKSYLKFSRDKSAFGTLEIGRVIIDEISEQKNSPLSVGKRNRRNKIRSKKLQQEQHQSWLFNTDIDRNKIINKKRIAFIVPYSIYGGAEIYIKNLISEADKDLYDISILYIQKNILAQQDEVNFVKHVQVRNINHLKGLAMNNNYDFIVFYNREDIYRALSSLKKDNKISSSLAEIYHSDFQWSGSLSRIRKRECVDIMFRISDSLAEDITGIKNLVTVPVGINVSKFSKKTHVVKDDAFNFLGERRYTIGTVARLSKEKNIEYIIDLAAKMEKCSFVIIGDGPNRGALQDKIKIMGIKNVYLVGFRKDIHKYYHLFDGFILASKIEGIPISIIESMASGVTVFSNMVGAIPDVIKDGFTGHKIYQDVDIDSKIIMKNLGTSDIAKKARSYIEINHNAKKNSRLFFESLISTDNLYTRVIPGTDTIFIKGKYI